MNLSTNSFLGMINFEVSLVFNSRVWVLVVGIMISGYQFLAWFFAPPPCLAHLPAVDVYKYCFSIFCGEGFDTRANRLVAPLLKQHGVVRLWLGQWFLVIHEPDKVRQVLTDADTYLKFETKDGSDETLAGRFLGHNLVESNGSTWRRHRLVANPAFKRGWSTEIFGKVANRLVACIKPGKSMDANELFLGVTLDALGLSIFDFDFKALENPDGPYPALYKRILDSIMSPLFGLFPIFDKLPFPWRIQARRDVDEFRNLFRELIEQRRKTKKKHSSEHNRDVDLVALMVEANEATNETGKPLLSDNEIINDAVLFFFVGHDTTANTMTFMMYYLSVNQDIQERARQEVHKILDRKQGMQPIVATLEQQNQFNYLTAIIYESIRIAPVAFMIGRETKYTVNDLVDFPVDPKTGIMVHMGLCLQNPNLWENPTKFNPDRFINNDFQLNQTAMKNMAGFGLGPRMCMGMKFALVEQRVTLALLLQNFSFHLPPNSPHQRGPRMNALGVPTPRDLELVFQPITY